MANAKAETLPLPSTMGVRGTPFDCSLSTMPLGTVVEVRQDVFGQPVVIEEINTSIVEYADDCEIWERQPGEPDNYWKWFTAFRDMDSATRTLANTYRRVTGKEVYWKSPDRFQLAWNLWNWKERALAYDRHVDEIHRNMLENARLKARVKTMQLGKCMREKAAEALIVLEAIIYKNVPQEDGTIKRVTCSALTPAQIARLAEVGVKLERLAVGEDNAGPGGGTTAVQVNVRIGDDELVERAQAIIKSRQD